jgi:hypothetical protein
MRAAGIAASSIFNSTSSMKPPSNAWGSPGDTAMANGNMIVPYILDPSHPQRLEIAIEIVKSYAQIKETIIWDFINKLKSSFATQLPEFTVEVECEGYERGKYHYIAVEKDSWQRDGQGIRIVLQSQKRGLRDFIIGVSKADHPSEDEWPELFVELESNYGPGRRHPWWYYFRRIDRFADWDHETLMELRKPSTLDFFVEQFERIRSIAGPIIDSTMVPSAP